jgi:hypothetical protein
MIPIVDLAAALVAALASHLGQVATLAAGALGPAAAKRLAELYDRVNERLKPSAKHALEELGKAPSNQVAQATLRLELLSQLEEDPPLRAELGALVEDLRPEGFAIDTHINGDGGGNKVVAIDGEDVAVAGAAAGSVETDSRRSQVRGLRKLASTRPRRTDKEIPRAELERSAPLLSRATMRNTSCGTARTGARSTPTTPPRAMAVTAILRFTAGSARCSFLGRTRLAQPAPPGGSAG